MGGVPVLVMLAAMGVGFGHGWIRGEGGQVEYIIQVPPDKLADIRAAGEISSTIPEPLRGHVSRVIIRVGNDVPPREPIADLLPSSRSPVMTAGLVSVEDQSPTPIPVLGPDQPVKPIVVPSDQMIAQVDRQDTTVLKPQGNGLSLPSIPGDLANQAGQAISDVVDAGQSVMEELKARAQNRATGPSSAFPSTSPQSPQLPSTNPSAQPSATTRERLGIPRTTSSALGFDTDWDTNRRTSAATGSNQPTIPAPMRITESRVAEPGGGIQTPGVSSASNRVGTTFMRNPTEPRAVDNRLGANAQLGSTDNLQSPRSVNRSLTANDSLGGAARRTASDIGLSNSRDPNAARLGSSPAWPPNANPSFSNRSGQQPAASSAIPSIASSDPAASRDSDLKRVADLPRAAWQGLPANAVYYQGNTLFDAQGRRIEFEWRAEPPFGAVDDRIARPAPQPTQMGIDYLNRFGQPDTSPATGSFAGYGSPSVSLPGSVPTMAANQAGAPRQPSRSGFADRALTQNPSPTATTITQNQPRSASDSTPSPQASDSDDKTVTLTGPNDDLPEQYATAQHYFNGLLLASLLGNVYLFVWLRNLRNHFHGMVAAKRGGSDSSF